MYRKENYRWQGNMIVIKDNITSQKLKEKREAVIYVKGSEKGQRKELELWDLITSTSVSL